ncbi:hypothetical protein [Micromonospora aurantiaca (nom. illeg.)]|uniref:Uncharacterized protein n=1 Tax=Micromonospora aurantiaca (nom. illeg.) TaxID=47850 RepID=A0ABQ6UMP2_9ACTN|nr:hypothetical protein [Micromonospora aurantiaca]KAB1118502.1 hypothetical protein F6X54_03455 [Micromonospora aurantiaca]
METVEYSYEALAGHVAEASDEALVVAVALCLYRISPIFGGDNNDLDLAALERVEQWGSTHFLENVRNVFAGLRDGLGDGVDEEEPEAVAELQRMAAAAVRGLFAEESSIAELADLVSTVSLDIGQELDGRLSEVDEEVGPKFFPAGHLPDLTPLEAAEIVDQIDVLVNLSAGQSANSRRVLEIAKNGRQRIGDILQTISAAEG